MFERFTEQARRVLFFARYETTQLGNLSIEPQHLLLGLLRESRGITVRLFEAARVSPDALRAEVQTRNAFERHVPTSVEVPFSEPTKHVLQYAAEEADRLLHAYIGTEHLLLGLLREEASMAATLLAIHGLYLVHARVEVVRLLNRAVSQPPMRETGIAEQVQQIELLKQLVARLAQTPADDVGERRELALRILLGLESLKPPDAGQAPEQE